MGQAAAKLGDKIINKPGMQDIHMVVTAILPPPPPVPVMLPFSGIIQGGVSSNVRIMGKPAATVGSTAKNIPPHIPPAGTTFVIPPTNEGTIISGSMTVKINSKMAARQGDTALTCDDPAPMPVGQVDVPGISTVNIGG